MENETPNYTPPVTEAEMRDWFHRLATMAVGYSSQAQALDTIRREVTNLVARIDALEAENAKLRTEVGETWEFAHRVEAEREQVKRDLEVERQINAGLNTRVNEVHDALINTDARLSEANDRNRQLQGDLNAMGSNLAEAKSSVEYWSARCQRAESDANDVRNVSAERGRTIHALEAEIHSLKAKLEKVKAALEEQVQAVVSAVA